MGVNPAFWRGRRVLVTGHTGFKGAWLTLWLQNLGAEVSGIALPPPTVPSLFETLAPWPELDSQLGDLRDPAVAYAMLGRTQPEIVLHLAAQALVRPSYDDPAGTFASNVMGTAHLLDAARKTPAVKMVLVVTSDKVYCNDNSGRPFHEDDRLGGGDPYSASKACQEFVAASFRRSFLNDTDRIVSARAGNVIGGGDWARDRLVPDFVRAVAAGQPIVLRNPQATRPWQHVLDPLAGYLQYVERLYTEPMLPSALNFGPDTADVRPVQWIIEQLMQRWPGNSGWRLDEAATVAEARALTLDASVATRTLGWRPRLSLVDALDWTVAWYRAYADGQDMRAYSLDEIRRYQELNP